MSFQTFVLPLVMSVIRFSLFVLVRESGINEYENLEAPPQTMFYDFIVIGSGSAGAVVGARLSEEPSWNVLVLESGGPPPAETFVPALDITNVIGEADWGYRIAPQKDAMFAYEGRSNLYPRGRGLGGSSTINFMMYVRGNRKDYDDWASLGNPGWDYDTLLHYFKKSEDFKGHHNSNDSYYHGYEGPMQIQNKGWSTPVGKTFLDVAEELGYPVNDPNADVQTGFSMPDMNIKNGLRHSTAEAFLRPNLHRKNLNVLPFAHVTKILFSAEKMAVGVKYLFNGKERVALAKREVILSAGAIDSPKLLMLSGVGPKEHLEKHDIEVIHDLPGVGKNLHDHPVIFGLTWLVNQGSALSISNFLRAGDIFGYFKHRQGILSVPMGVEGNAWVSLEEERPDWPDTQYLFMSVTPAFDYGLLFQSLIGFKRNFFEAYFKPAFGNEGFCIGPILTRPKSRGSVTLKDKHPLTAPIIDPKFLSHPDDLRLMAKAAKFAIKIGNSKSMKEAHNANFLDTPLFGCEHLPLESDSYYECYAQHMTSTVYHPVGTCKMAPYTDKMGVVDNRLRVRGMKGLRVIDASIMPLIPSGNTNAPSIMVGERGADLVKEDWMKEMNYV